MKKDVLNIKLKLEEKDFRNYNIMKFSSSFSKIMLIVFTVGAFIFFLNNYISTGRYLLITLLTGASLVFYIATFVYLIPKQAKAVYVASYYYEKEVPFTISDYGLTINRDGGSISNLPWQGLYSAWEHNGYFLFYVSINNVLLLPKRQLSADDIIFIKHTIKCNVDSKKRRNPYRLRFKAVMINLFIYGVVAFVVYFTILSFKK